MDGENQIRVLSEPRMVESTFKGNLNRKWPNNVSR
jgi:hypothetical protein